MRVLGRKPQGYGGGNEVYGVEKNLSRLKLFSESTQTRRRVEWIYMFESTRRRDRVDSATQSSRLKISRLNVSKNKKVQTATQFAP